MLRVSSLNIDPVQAAAAPLTVSNWECFDGALLAVCFQYGDTHVIDGTAVMIGLGLALSAKHVFDNHRDALYKGHAVLLCFGMCPNGRLDIWHCYAMSPEDGDGDLELLSLKLVSDLPADGHFMVTPLTTRIPPPGEALTVVGFRFEDSASTDSIHNPVTLGGLLYVSQGAAGQFSYPIHDSVVAPYPTIEILSGSLGGMSGGAAFDGNGRLIGIISRGDDASGFVSLLWPSVFTPIELAWPPVPIEGRITLASLTSIGWTNLENLENLIEAIDDDGTPHVGLTATVER